ncbi:MAG: GNAT family protein [Candidatus Parcubacteria bacterium]|nr:GNAT family protein [Candidatus Parcubacteria bacterium]
MSQVNNKKIKLVSVTNRNLKDLYFLISDKKIVGNFQPHYGRPFLAFKHKFSKTKVKYYLVKNKMSGELLGYAYWAPEPRFNSFEIGATIIPSQRGQGYGLHSHQVLISLLEKKYKCDRIQAITASQNANEIAVLNKCGFLCEGTLSKAGKIGNRFLDLCIFGKIIRKK